MNILSLLTKNHPKTRTVCGCGQFCGVAAWDSWSCGLWDEQISCCHFQRPGIVTGQELPRDSLRSCTCGNGDHCLSWKQRQSNFLIQLSPELSSNWRPALLYMLKIPLCINFLPWGKPAVHYIRQAATSSRSSTEVRWHRLQVIDIWFLQRTTDQNYISSTIGISWWREHLACTAVLIRGGSPWTHLSDHGRDEAAGKAAHQASLYCTGIIIIKHQAILLTGTKACAAWVGFSAVDKCLG